MSAPYRFGALSLYLEVGWFLPRCYFVLSAYCDDEYVCSSGSAFFCLHHDPLFVTCLELC